MRKTSRDRGGRRAWPARRAPESSDERSLDQAREDARDCRRCELACRFWLEEEIAAVAPRVIVALGAIAARAVVGPAARVLRDRGQWLASPPAPNVTVTVHPSSLLRAPTPEARQAARTAFVDDLRAVAKRLAEPAS